LRGKSGAQAVAGVFRGIEACSGGGPLYDQPNGVFVQRPGLQPAMPV
jgi:hypothetical protein